MHQSSFEDGNWLMVAAPSSYLKQLFQRQQNGKFIAQGCSIFGWTAVYFFL